MLSKEQRAQIARENGAKSKGPTTAQGKANSSRNGIKSGVYATKLTAFVPPHSAVLCNEERQSYFSLLSHLLQIYLPINQEASEMVRQIAIARWQINRLQTQITNLWNVTLLNANDDPEETMHSAAAVAAELFSGPSPVEKMNRQIDRLELRITRLRKGILEVHRHFPNSAKPMETKESPAETEESEPTVFVTEPTPEVLSAYRRKFPNHKIIIMPPDLDSGPADAPAAPPPAPRRAA